MNKLYTLAFIGLAAFSLTGCGSGLAILDGSTHACGTVHVEGYFTDTEGEVVIVKAPPEWTPEDVKDFCAGAE